MKEIWKDVFGYEGYYEVSNIGNVRSVDRCITKKNGEVQRRKSRIMTQRLNSDGYWVVKLSRDGVSKTVPVHTLVARAFVDGYFEGAEVNHKDCNRRNNVYTNLEWCTHKENIEYCLNLGRHVSQFADYTGSNNPNYHNRTLRKKYAADPSLAQEKQSRPGSANGRAKRIQVQLHDGACVDFDYIGDCAMYLIKNGYTKAQTVNSVRTAISNAIKNNRKYKGLSVRFL